jgi:hypothetical protein
MVLHMEMVMQAAEKGSLGIACRRVQSRHPAQGSDHPELYTFT